MTVVSVYDLPTKLQRGRGGAVMTKRHLSPTALLILPASPSVQAVPFTLQPVFETCLQTSLKAKARAASPLARSAFLFVCVFRHAHSNLGTRCSREQRATTSPHTFAPSTVVVVYKAPLL